MRRAVPVQGSTIMAGFRFLMLEGRSREPAVPCPKTELVSFTLNFLVYILYFPILFLFTNLSIIPLHEKGAINIIIFSYFPFRNIF